MKKIKLNPHTKINAITIVDKINPNVINSQNMNTTIAEFIVGSSIQMISKGKRPSVIPNLFDVELDFVMDASGRTSKGYSYKASAYKYEDNNKLIFVNVIERFFQK
jgi:hypothetical protein